MNYRQISLSAPMIWTGYSILIEESLSYPPIRVGIDTNSGTFSYSGSGATRGGPVEYLDNGDGIGNLLVDIPRDSLVTDGSRIYQVGKQYPLDATSMRRVDDKRTAQNLRDRMRAAGFTDTQIALAAAAAPVQIKR